MRLRSDAQPLAYMDGRYNTYPLYDEAAVTPKRRSNKKPAMVPATIETADVLAATFSVNRSAKRYRDAARSCYASRAFAFATRNREQKESLYDLKDAGIAWLVHRGDVEPVAIHGGFCMYRGHGYCFHSTLRPVGAELGEPSEDDGMIFVESKPRTAKDMRLKDAKAILQAIYSNAPLERFERLAAPQFVKQKPRYDGYAEDYEDDWDEVYP